MGYRPILGYGICFNFGDLSCGLLVAIQADTEYQKYCNLMINPVLFNKIQPLFNKIDEITLYIFIFEVLLHFQRDNTIVFAVLFLYKMLQYITLSNVIYI